MLKNTHKTELKFQKNLQNLQNFQFSLSYFPPFKILYRIIVKKETFVKKNTVFRCKFIVFLNNMLQYGNYLKFYSSSIDFLLKNKV